MKTVTFILSLSIILLAAACEPAIDDLFEKYTILKNEHFCQQKHPEALQSTRLFFQARFDQSARYIFPESSSQDSKNKLMGFSDCNSAHHENSARYAWQWYNDRLEIFAYCYVAGKRIEAFLGTVEIDEIATYQLDITNSAYRFTFKGNELEIPRQQNCSTGVYYMLWPYFGGGLPAPHDVIIEIRRF